MKILIYGAGVLGSVYAARLSDAGHQISIVARGQRLAELRAHGIVLSNVLTGRTTTTTAVQVLDRLEPAAGFDLIAVVMGKHQVADILPALAANRASPSILFLHNNAAGPQALADAVGPERVLLGFAGAGGRREGESIHYLLIKQQPTTLGALDGSTTPRCEQIAGAFRDAGFPTAISPNIDAALKTHAVFIASMEAAIIAAGGSNEALAQRHDLLLLLVNAIHEGFAALTRLGIPVIPFNLRLLFTWMPRSVPVRYWRNALQSPLGELSLAGHANAAPGEITQLVEEIRALVRPTALPTPAMDRLFGYVEPLPHDQGRPAS
jgi:2-dehydropantoate 2-reductase